MATLVYRLLGRGGASNKFLPYPRWLGLVVHFAFRSLNSGVCWEAWKKGNSVAKELGLLRHEALVGKALGGKASLSLLLSHFKIHCLSKQEFPYLKSSYPEFLWLVRNRPWLTNKVPITGTVFCHNTRQLLTLSCQGSLHKNKCVSKTQKSRFAES